MLYAVVNSWRTLNGQIIVCGKQDHNFKGLFGGGEGACIRV
jgi:hypothetical protein